MHATRGLPSRRPVDPDELLKAARVVIARDGAAAAQMKQIAVAAGTTSPTLLYHFGSRQELLAQALAQKDERWLEKFERYASDHGAIQQMKFAIDWLLNPSPRERTAWRRDWSVWFEAWVVALHEPVVAEACRSQERRWCDLFAQIVAQGFDEGIFVLDRRPALSIAEEIMALVDGFALRLLLGPSSITHARAARHTSSAARQLCGMPR